MSYEVRFLTDEESEKYYGYTKDKWDLQSDLGIFIDGKLNNIHSDGGEPEDNSFGRNWGWVPQALEQAYQKGLEDANPKNSSVLGD